MWEYEGKRVILSVLNKGQLSVCSCLFFSKTLAVISVSDFFAVVENVISVFMLIQCNCNFVWVMPPSFIKWFFFSPSLFYYCHYQCCHDYDFCDITLPFALHASFELHGVWCQQTFAAITEICCATSWNCICSGFTSGTFFLFHVCCFIVLDIPASAQPDLRKVENFLGNRTSCLGVIVSATVRCWHHHHLTSVVVIFMMITGSCAMMIGLCRCTHIAWWSIMLHSFKNKQMSYFSVFTQMTCVNMQKHLVWMCEFFLMKLTTLTTQQ